MLVRRGGRRGWELGRGRIREKGRRGKATRRDGEVQRSNHRVQQWTAGEKRFAGTQYIH